MDHDLDMDVVLGDVDEHNLPDVLDEQLISKLMYRLRWLRRKRAEAELQAREAWAEIDEYLAAQRHRYSTEQIEATLANYHRARRADDPKAKTLYFPAGELESTARQPKWEFDEETFIEWAAKNRPHLLVETVETTIAKAEVKKALTVKDDGVVDPDSGELVPGVSITPAEVSYRANTRPVF